MAAQVEQAERSHTDCNSGLSLQPSAHRDHTDHSSDLSWVPASADSAHTGYKARNQDLNPALSVSELVDSDLVNMAHRGSGSFPDYLDRDYKDSAPALKAGHHMPSLDSRWDRADSVRRGYCSG